MVSARRRLRGGGGLGVLVVALVLGGWKLWGFSFGGGASSPPRRGAIVTEHRFAPAAYANKRFGEDCAVHGGTECLTGFCLHYQADPALGYACTAHCKSRMDCPAGWGCAQVYPAPGMRYCTPPIRWTPAPVAPQGPN